MAEPTPFRIDAPPDPAVASRVQARLDGLEQGASPPTDRLPAPTRGRLPGDPWATRPAPGAPPASAPAVRPEQLEVLREQLDQVFDDLEDRIAEIEARVVVAEARASAAEARASVAEARAADAELRADDAVRRVDVVLGSEVGYGQAPAPGDDAHRRTDLRSALDRLRDRLDHT